MKRTRASFGMQVCFLAVFIVVLSVRNAFAIPSPELVIGSISSLSQIGALVAATVGGGVLAIGRRLGIKAEGSGKALLRVAGVLLLICLGLMALNFWQYQSHSAERTERLQATLTRPAQTDGTKIHDSTLKETSFGAQESHPLAMTTAQAAHLISSADPNTAFWDVREAGENQTGTLPNAIHKRFPDVSADEVKASGKQVVLFCHNGNRSSETCARLAALGIDCKFIAGGIEKWILEDRPFTDPNVRGLSDLRAIPDFPNKTTLLDTPDVKSLLASGDVGILDTRYPGDFEIGHLPNAINIPIRAMPTDILTEKIAALEKKPYIAACYDRRSCFMSQVLALELSKAGHTFLGRYTLPWEYFVPKPPKPHIVAWMAEQNRSTWDRVLAFVTDKVAVSMIAYGVLLTVLGVALISRLLVLPISIKAEQDQIKTRQHSDELAALKAQTRLDPARQARAVKAFYAKHNITPMRNLLALAFLPLMMLGLTSINGAAGQVGSPLLWVGNSGLPDPTYSLPLLFAVLGCVYLQIALTKTTRGRVLCWVIGGPVLFGLSAFLSAAGSLYLVISLVLLLIQRAWIEGTFGRFYKSVFGGFKRWRTDRFLHGMIPLNRSYALMGSGNKAWRLAVLVGEGVKVPRGLVLNAHFLEEFKAANTAKRTKRLDAIWTFLHGKKLAVRSSGSAEDGANKSYAGVFDSYLDITRDTLEQAILDVDWSFQAARSHGYHGDANGMAANVLIQQMVDADFAGVLFTKDPQHPTLSMLEYVQGTADDLVSGRRNPTMLRFGRSTMEAMDDQPDGLDFTPLLKIGQQIEAIFGTAQDIEWAYEGGMFYIVQTRDITATTMTEPHEIVIEAEWARLMDTYRFEDAQKIVLMQDDMSEVLPRPTPLSFSVMQRLWAAGGSVDLACQALGLQYRVPEDGRSHLTTVFGRLYSDALRKADSAVVLSKRGMRYIRKQKTQLAANFRQDFLPGFQQRIARYEALNTALLSEDDLKACFKELHDWFTFTVHVEVETINIAASFFVDEAKAVAKAHGQDSAAYLGVVAPSSPSSFLAEASRLSNGKQAAFLKKHMGHRAVFDYELEEPRYSEVPHILKGLVPPDAKTPLIKSPKGLPEDLQAAITTAQTYLVLKEEAKHQSLRVLACLRAIIRQLDKATGGRGLCFYLSYEEMLDELPHLGTYAREKAESNRAQYQAFMKVPPLASNITVALLERASYKSPSAADIGDGVFKGTRVSGANDVTGRAYLVDPVAAENGAALDGFAEGDIIVCTMVHPAWLSEVLKSGGVISCVGGWLSHMAIVAREHDVPMVVGVPNALDLPDGDMVTIHADGTVTLAEEGPNITQIVAE